MTLRVGFADKLRQRSSGEPIHFIWGRDVMGRPCHWFLQCSERKYLELQRLFGTQPVSFSQYGKVVARGNGMQPDPATLDMLKAEYRYTFEG